MLNHTGLDHWNYIDIGLLENLIIVNWKRLCHRIRQNIERENI